MIPPTLPEMGDEDIERLAEELMRMEPADMGSVLDAALLTELQGLSAEDEELLGKIFSGDLSDLTPEKLDQIAAKAPGLGIYLRNMRQANQTGDPSILGNMVDDVVAATGYKPETGPDWDLTEIEFDSEEE
jgi:hypothetical protein